MKTKRSRQLRRSDRHNLLDIRLLVLLIASFLIGGITATISWMATANVWMAALAGLAAAGCSLERLHNWIE